MSEAEKSAQPASAVCGNCGAPIAGAYCSTCGQDTKPGPPTVPEYLRDLITHFIHLDGIILRTLASLFFLPGRLPRDYLANKRARYVKPLKLYFFVVALAFSLVQFLRCDLGLTLGSLRLNLFQAPRAAVPQDQSNVDTSHWVLKYLNTEGIRRFKALSAEEQLKVKRERGIRYIPYVALGLVLVFAALLQLVYTSPPRRYGAHLVFSLYSHSFLLLIFAIEAKLPMALATIFSIWLILYYPLALKCVYGGTWSATVARGSIIAIAYFLSFLVLGVLITALLLSV